MRAAIVTAGDLGRDFVLSPERHLSAKVEGPRLGDLVTERRERAAGGLVLDTTHVKDGLIDVHAAARDATPPRSPKRAARAGDVLVSRLRPYLRQIAYVHPMLTVSAPLAVSTEFYVLAGEHIAWLVPFLLGAGAQRALGFAQEGGHHPRVPRDSLFGLPVPAAVVRAGPGKSAAMVAALAELYRSREVVEALMRDAPSRTSPRASRARSTRA